MSSTTPTYDVVFAGGGTTACVVAGRLAEADPSLKILILETGPHTHDLPAHVQPARYMQNLGIGKAFTMHKGVASQALGGRSPIIPTGRCVGGGSSVNFTMYTRASASDFDDWEKLSNPGWGSKDMIPLARKVETFQIEEGSPKVHGTSGPIKVSRGGYDTNIGREFIQTGGLYDKDRGVASDTNDFKTVDKYSPWHKYIDRDTGKRSDVAHHFIYNQAHNKNLHVLAEQRVVRVIFKNKRAVGVEYVADDEHHRDGPSHPHTAYASRLVVVSGGAFGSPAILERSGIGAKQHLAKCDVQQIVDLPGVGEGYQDHNLVIVPYAAGDDSDCFDTFFGADEETNKPHVEEFITKGSGFMAANFIDAAVKMRPTQKDLEEVGPSFTKIWNEVFANAPDKPVVITCAVAANLGTAPSATSKTFAIANYSMYPLASGYTHISSGTDPKAPLNFDPKFFEHYADLAILRWSYKHGREMARRMPSYRGEVAAGHPKFSSGGAAAIVTSASGPVPISTPQIMYTAQDNQAIDDFLRASVATTWHSLGTCAMKPQEQGGVVDSRLNVYGVHNLKVADLSIAPLNVGANTYNTALLVGEKAFLIIAEELGITVKN